MLQNQQKAIQEQIQKMTSRSNTKSYSSWQTYFDIAKKKLAGMKSLDNGYIQIGDKFKCIETVRNDCQVGMIVTVSGISEANKDFYLSDKTGKTLSGTWGVRSRYFERIENEMPKAYVQPVKVDRKPDPFKRHPDCDMRSSHVAGKMCTRCEWWISIQASRSHIDPELESEKINPRRVSSLPPLNNGRGSAVFGSWNGRVPR